MKQIEYAENSTVLERIFPWMNSGRNRSESNKTSRNVAKDQTPKNETIQIKPQESSEKMGKLHSRNEKLAAIHKQQYTLLDDEKSASIFEMWNVIESVGIKRDMLSRVITSEEAITELYYVIEKRIHYDREQEMIRRLRQHVTKLNASNMTKK